MAAVPGLADDEGGRGIDLPEGRRVERALGLLGQGPRPAPLVFATARHERAGDQEQDDSRWSRHNGPRRAPSPGTPIVSLRAPKASARPGGPRRVQAHGAGSGGNGLAASLIRKGAGRAADARVAPPSAGRPARRQTRKKQVRRVTPTTGPFRMWQQGENHSGRNKPEAGNASPMRKHRAIAGPAGRAESRNAQPQARCGSTGESPAGQARAEPRARCGSIGKSPAGQARSQRGSRVQPSPPSAPKPQPLASSLRPEACGLKPEPHASRLTPAFQAAFRLTETCS